MLNFKPAPVYVYALYVDDLFLGYTNRFDQKVMYDVDDNLVRYFGLYATPELANEGDTCKHSRQVWLKEDKQWKLFKIKI